MAEEKIILPEDDDWLDDFQGGGESDTLIEGLGQSDIDDLLDTGLEGTPAQQPQAAVEEGVMDLEGLDQSQVDELLGSIEEEEPPPAPSAPDQDEIDQLFEEVSKEEEKAGETAAPATNSDTFDLDFETIEADDFGFDEDIAEIPDEVSAVAEASAPVIEEAKAPPKKKSKRVIPFLNRKNLAIAASLVVLLGVGTMGYLLVKNRKVVEVAQAPQQVAVQKPPPPPPPNSIPEANPAQYNMSRAGEELALQLSGQDADGDALVYEISRAPLHGQLIGAPPAVSYVAENNFPGKDVFEFTVSDGKKTSSPVAVIITGPDLRVRQARKSVPRKPTLSAVNVTMKTLSTEPLEIDWEKIWRQSNHAAFGKNVKVLIEKEPEHGVLARTKRNISVYEPDDMFTGRDSIRYRFEKDGKRSKIRQVKLLVDQGDIPPRVALRPLAKEIYTPGETVILDASGSQDDSRESLEFSWQQLAGAAVRFRPMNDEGSIVSFVVPSSFYSGEASTLRVRVTVVDRLDQLESADMEITTLSRRRAALWRGHSSGEVAPEPHCPQGDCAGSGLPWPYVR